jgi:hypothetical protein
MLPKTGVYLDGTVPQEACEREAGFGSRPIPEIVDRVVFEEDIYHHIGVEAYRFPRAQEVFVNGTDPHDSKGERLYAIAAQLSLDDAGEGGVEGNLPSFRVGISKESNPEHTARLVALVIRVEVTPTVDLSLHGGATITRYVTVEFG